MSIRKKLKDMKQQIFSRQPKSKKTDSKKGQDGNLKAGPSNNDKR